MTFEVGKAYRTRGGGTAVVMRGVDDGIIADHGNGKIAHHHPDGRYGHPGFDAPRDLLPGTIEDAGGGATASIVGAFTGVGHRAVTRTVTLTYNTPKEARAVFDALAAERARRGEVG